MAAKAPHARGHHLRFQAVAFNVPIAEFHTARSLERNSQVPKLGPDVLGEEFSNVDAGCPGTASTRCFPSR